MTHFIIYYMIVGVLPYAKHPTLYIFTSQDMTNIQGVFFLAGLRFCEQYGSLSML